MKILHISASYKPAFIYGGPIMSVSMLCEALAQAVESVTVFTTNANGDTDLPIQTGVDTVVEGVHVWYFHRLTGDHTHFSPSLLKFLWERASNFDVIHVHGWWNTVSVLGGLIALLRGKPLIISPRGMLSEYSFGSRNNIKKWIIHTLIGKYILRNGFRHVTSQNEYDANLRLRTPFAMFNIPNLVKLPGVKPVQKESRGVEFKILFFSRIEKKKGLDILLNALPLLNFPYHLTICGDGDPVYIHELKNLAPAQTADLHITWAGFRTSDKFDILAGEDLMVLPSFDENFGNVVIESLSVGTAVLISRHVGLADYVEKEKMGWISEASVVSVASSLNLIYHHKEELNRIRETSPGKIAMDFEKSRLIGAYMNMYHRVVSTR